MSIFAPDKLAQNINPWSWWTKLSDNVSGFINIVTYKSSNPETEHSITHEIAGYGMQLNIIEKALSATIELLPKNQTLTAPQTQAFEEFSKMIADIQAHKEQIALEKFRAGGIDGLISDIHYLKETDLPLYKELSEKLKKAL